MLFYCLKRRKTTESKNSKVPKTNKGQLIILSECDVFDSKKSSFIKNQEASGVLTSLGIKAGLD